MLMRNHLPMAGLAFYHAEGDPSPGGGEAAGEAGTGDGGRKFSQDDVNNIVAKVSKPLEAKLAEVNKELEVFRDQDKKRKEKNKTEIEKANSEIDTLKARIAELEPYRETVENQTKAAEEKVTKLEKDLDENQKTILSGITDPLKKLEAIDAFKVMVQKGPKTRNGGDADIEGFVSEEKFNRMTPAERSKNIDAINASVSKW